MLIQTLEDLTQHIKQSIPQPRAITKLQHNTEADLITFDWHGRHFLVRKSLQVLEMKGNNLFVTGASMLMTTVLMKANKNSRVIETTMGILQEAEEFIGSGRRIEAGLKLLTTIRGTLLKLAGSSNGTARA